MKRRKSSFIFLLLLATQATAQAAGYLKLEDPAPSIAPISGYTEFADRAGTLRKFPNDPDRDYYWGTPTAANPFPIVSFPKGQGGEHIRVVWDPELKKPVGVVPGEELYLNRRTQKLVRVPANAGVAISSTGLAIPLRHGQIAYEDDKQRTSVVDVTEQYEIHFDGGKPYVGRAQKTGELATSHHLPTAAELEARMFQYDPNHSVYATAEDAMRGVNPVNQKNLPRGESLASGPQDPDSIPEFSSSAALPPPPEFPENKTPVRGPIYDGIWERQARMFAGDHEYLDKNLYPSPDAATPPPAPGPHAPPAVAQAGSPPAAAGEAKPDITQSYGYQQAHEVYEHAAYAEAYTVFGPKDSKLPYLERKKQFENDPRLAKFTQIYTLALKATQSALPPVKLAQKLGLNEGMGESDPTYVSVTRGMALDLVKKHYPEFWKTP